MMVPVIFACKVQVYGYVPATVNVLLKVVPAAIIPLSNKLSSLITLWLKLSLLIHLTVVFTETVRVAGLNFELCIHTSLAAGVAGVASSSSSLQPLSDKKD